MNNELTEADRKAIIDARAKIWGSWDNEGKTPFELAFMLAEWGIKHARAEGVPYEKLSYDQAEVIVSQAERIKELEAEVATTKEALVKIQWIAGNREVLAIAEAALQSPISAKNAPDKHWYAELTPEDRTRFRDWVMQHMEMGMQSSPANFARLALEYATLYERTALKSSPVSVDIKTRKARELLLRCQTYIFHTPQTAGLINDMFNWLLEDEPAALSKASSPKQNEK